MAFPGLNPDDYIIDGELTGYHSGTKYFVANYKKGVLDGAFTEFYRDGQLYSNVNFSNGVKSGAYNKSLSIEYSGNHLTHLTDCGNCLTGGEFRK